MSASRSRSDVRPNNTDVASDAENAVDEEIVERNGESVVRVKKRKRRSQQKKHEVQSESRSRLFRFILTLVSFFVLIGITAALLMMYVNGGSFERKVEKTISNELGGDAVVSGLSVSPSIFTAKSLTLTGSKDDFLQALTLEEIRGDHRSYGILGGLWFGDEISAESGSLIIDLNRPIISSAKESELSHDFSTFRCDKLDLSIKTAKGEVYLADAEAIWTMGELNLSGHQLDLVWPKNIILHSLNLKPGAIQNVHGSFELKGSKNFPYSGTMEKGLVNLKTTISDISIRQCYPDINHFVRGVLNFEDAKVSGELQSLVLSGEFSAERFSIQTLGINQLFERLQISKEAYLYREVEASGKMRIADKSLDIEHLKIANKKDFVITGKLNVTAGRIKGKLNISVSGSKKNIILNDSVLSRICKRQPNGNYGLTLNLGGSVENPTDDLSVRLHGARFGEMNDQDHKLLEDQLNELLQ